MTFDDDHLHINTRVGVVRVPLSDAGLHWPPPAVWLVGENLFVQVRRSQLTDEQRASLTHVMRGAEYVPARPCACIAGRVGPGVPECPHCNGVGWVPRDRGNGCTA